MFAAAALASSVIVLTAANSVGSSRLAQRTQAISAQDLAPPECAGLGLTTKVVATTSPASGTAGNDLFVGRSAVDVMDGGAGNDCVLGGGSSDSISGGAGTDVCVGGPGTDTLDVLSCETRIE